MAEVALKLAVWRPAKLQRRLAKESEGGQEWPVAALDSLYEEIYRWHLREDIWAVVADDTTRANLMSLLVEGLNPELSPRDRGIQKLQTVIAGFDQAVRGGATSWAPCEQQLLAGLEDDDETRLRADRLLSFTHHLRWIHQVFGSIPGMNVTIR